MLFFIFFSAVSACGSTVWCTACSAVKTLLRLLGALDLASAAGQKPLYLCLEVADTLPHLRQILYHPISAFALVGVYRGSA